MITFEFVVHESNHTSQALHLLFSAAKKTTPFFLQQFLIAGEKGPQTVFVTWLQNGLMRVYSATQELVCAYLHTFEDNQIQAFSCLTNPLGKVNKIRSVCV